MDAADFRPGDRVELIRMSDPYVKVPAGALGTVVGIAPRPINVLNVEWDNGCGLNPCLDEDEVRKIGSCSPDEECEL